MSRDAKSVFVGREVELERMSQALNATTGGVSRIVALVGEPGIGKTATATEFSNAIRESEIEVYWGKCYEGAGAPIYWPWIQITREYLESHDPETIAAAIGTGTAAIAEVIPEVAAHTEPTPSLKPLDDPLSVRFRFF